MLEKKIGKLFRGMNLLVVMTLLTNCKTKKPTILIDENIANAEVIHNSEEVIMKEENKVDGNNINAKFTCSGKSKIDLLQLADKKYDTDDFTCYVNKKDGLIIQFKSESKGMEIIFTLNGIESYNIEKSDYLCQTSGNLKFATVILNSKSLGSHNFGDTFEGKISITDYGMSSNIICGNFQLKDRKGNLIEGKFNEIIQTF